MRFRGEPRSVNPVWHRIDILLQELGKAIYADVDRLSTPLSFIIGSIRLSNFKAIRNYCCTCSKRLHGSIAAAWRRASTFDDKNSTIFFTKSTRRMPSNVRSIKTSTQSPCHASAFGFERGQANAVPVPTGFKLHRQLAQDRANTVQQLQQQQHAATDRAAEGTKQCAVRGIVEFRCRANSPSATRHERGRCKDVREDQVLQRDVL